MSTVANVQSRIAGLAENNQIISGVAIGVDDITRGLSGDQKVWRADELKQAAASLEGTPVNPLHSQSEVGEVVRAGFNPDRGVIYEAELEDESLAEQVADGQLEVSIEARHADGGRVETDRGEAMLATDIQFTGMALVQRGAAPSASATAGEAAALSVADITAALESDNPASTEGDAEDIEIDDSTETALENKVDEHNDEAAESKQVTLGMLKKVYRRGAGAWLNSNAGATQNQWAMARVNEFLEDLRNDRPLNDGNDNDLAPDGYDVAENASLVEINGTEVNLSPPERVVNAAELALEKKSEIDDLSDCGTGVGEAIAEAIIGDDLTPQIILDGGDIADNGGPVTYLSSHEEDAPDGPPTEWSDEQWRDGCGPVQYALWGHYLDWFEGKQAEIEDAMDGEEMAEAKLKAVGPVEFSGTVSGELDESEIPNDDYEGHYLNAADTKTASSFPLVDASGRLRRGNLDAAWDLRGQGDLGMPRDAAERVLKSLGREFGEPGSEANPIPQEAYNEGESAAADGTDDAVSPGTGQAEGSTGGEPDGRTDSEPRYNAHMSETEEELRARLSEKDDRIAELETEVEQLEAEREHVARSYAEALAAGDSILDEDDLVDKFSVAELREKFENTDNATLADVEPAVQSGSDSDEDEAATLSDAEQSEVAEHRDAIADLAGSETVIAEKERERRANLVADITGEDPDTILEQETDA
jgi:hypothetical protein